LEPKKAPDVPQISGPETPSEGPHVDVPGLPSIQIPGIHFPTLSFNWQSLRLARHNPELFMRLLKKFAWEAAKLAAHRLGEAVDPRNIDFSGFRDGQWDLVIYIIYKFLYFLTFLKKYFASILIRLHSKA
jgi:hypothetical protein